MSSVNFPLSIIIFPNCSYALMLTNDLEDTRQPRTVVKKLDTRRLEILYWVLLSEHLLVQEGFLR